ncbi:Ig-like domain-containing protein [Desulfitobacterium chlororespirans]|uniref:Ig-like domain (Group 2) n=1 Tax=Desulfitobacterium chlororespirans DSM 11544 TaxID=1121395 RepID=A0A1M7UY47_9FIRM|nr:Ig-like domain-containing protein [Desulfitobacterium chlororespirans]SHN87889.1 Ig-like domain (group 2) [Desulfitobacterium chlororespirans DSM 11544]
MRDIRKTRVMLGLLVTVLISNCFISLTPEKVIAHSGRTDSSGGHRDNKNASGLGSYHYHHGYGPHLHPNGICPYEAPAEIAVSSVSIASSKDTLDIGDSIELKAEMHPANATNKSVSWASSDTNIITVNSTGTITAVGVGTAVITVQSNNGMKDSTSISVIKPVEGISIEEDGLSFLVGEVKVLTANVTPTDATDMSVSWSSTDPSIIEVNDTGEAVAKSIGTATITAKTANGISDSIEVEVLELEENIPASSLPVKEADLTKKEDKTDPDNNGFESIVGIGILGAIAFAVRKAKKGRK